jgi:hypothetical protein
MERVTYQIWLLSYYREAELRGADLLQRLLRKTEDPDLQFNLTHHFADEAHHAWLWTELIHKLGGAPLPIVELLSINSSISNSLREINAEVKKIHYFTFSPACYSFFRVTGKPRATLQDVIIVLVFLENSARCFFTTNITVSLRATSTSSYVSIGRTFHGFGVSSCDVYFRLSSFSAGIVLADWCTHSTVLRRTKGGKKNVLPYYLCRLTYD